ncbi:MAG: aspartate--tRNA(Asn) ligase [Candidatus Micrarchaeota archaeon]|nr:aspartate--tRNA(Asn) ligase [Candidatus Micrarchaeota archaeon]
MLRVQYIEDTPKAPGSEIKIGGRVVRITDAKNVKFVWVRDISGMMQLTVLKESAGAELMKTVDGLMQNDFVVVSGKVPQEIKSKSGAEMLPEKIEVVGKSLEPSPIDVEGFIESSFDKRFDWRALDLRSPRQMAIFAVESKVLGGMHKYLSSQGFMQVFTPSLMGASSEGGSEVFTLRHFGKTAYLRQDPQLHRDLLMLAGYEKVYEIGPSWRAELSNTPRHMTEHRTCAAEMSFISDEKDIIKLETKLVSKVLAGVVKECETELKTLGAEVAIPKGSFPVFTFPKIYEILEGLGKHVEAGEDYDHEAELLLAKHAKEKYNSDFFFVDRFPFKVKPFYVMRVEKSPEWARSVDLIYKGVEISTGGQREHRYEKLLEQAMEKGLDLENLKWFTDFFKYGAPPHGGFSMGIERFTASLLNIENIRETTLFPRAPERLLP